MKLHALCIALVAFGTTACHKSAPAEGAENGKPAGHEEAKEEGTGAPSIKMDAATQKRVGLETAELAEARLPREIKAYGRVVSVSALASIVSELINARAASTASQAELARLRNLAAQNNTSQRALQAAEAAAIHDQTLVESAQLRLITDWGEALAKREDLAALVQALGSRAAALVQLEVPAGASFPAPPVSAQVSPLGADTNFVEASFVGPAPSVDPQFQGRGFFFLVQTNTAQLAPGAALTGFLNLQGDPETGVFLPAEAIVRYNGFPWVYVQVNDAAFERREISLEAPLRGGWFVRNSLKPRDKVVKVGAQQLLSQEVNTTEE